MAKGGRMLCRVHGQAAEPDLTAGQASFNPASQLRSQCVPSLLLFLIVILLRRLPSLFCPLRNLIRGTSTPYLTTFYTSGGGHQAVSVRFGESVLYKSYSFVLTCLCSVHAALLLFPHYPLRLVRNLICRDVQDSGLASSTLCLLLLAFKSLIPCAI
jgi:hypothetical protein